MARTAGSRTMRAALPRRRRTGWKWWQGMLGGMLLMVSPGAALLLAVLALPALLAAVADTTPRRALTRTVILFSLAGGIEPLRAFLAGGHDLAACAAVLGRPEVILLAWLAAGSGWVLDELLCLAATLVTNLRHAARRAALEATLLQLRAEWGLAEGLPPPS